MKKFLLLPLLFFILFLSNCNKQSTTEQSKNNVDPISEKLRTNADYQHLIASSNDVRMATIRILQPLIQYKKNRITEIPAEIQRSIRKQLGESILILSVKSNLSRIIHAIPELKSLSRQDFSDVWTQARQMVKKDLKLKFSLTGIGNSRMSSDHPCEDSCDAVYALDFELVEENHNYAIVNCLAHRAICEDDCGEENDECLDDCALAYEDCEREADTAYYDLLTQLMTYVLACWDTCIDPPTS